jgi:hypothetical protein
MIPGHSARQLVNFGDEKCCGAEFSGNEVA